MLRERVAGDVRFLKQREPGDSSTGELMPLRFSDRVKLHFEDQPVE
jgi:hypothetical protein